jgi:hypothetical protein
MAEQLKNDASTTLSAAITSSGATTCTVTAAPSNTTFGRLSATAQYVIRVWEGDDDAPTKLELMRVTGISGSTLTVTRGVESTTATTFASGAKVAQVLSATSLANYVSENAGGGGGLSGLTTNKVLVAASGTTVITPTNLSWDNTNSRLGIGAGATTPGYPLHVAEAAQQVGQFTRTDAGQMQVRLATGGDSGFMGCVVNAERSRTTYGSPSVVSDGDTSLQLNAAVFTSGTTFSSLGSITLASDGGSGSGSAPGRIVFSTTPSGSTSNVERLRLTAEGNMSFGASQSFGGGVGVVFLANRTTAPTSNPTGGAILYAEGGAIKARGSSGTVTTIAAA